MLLWSIWFCWLRLISSRKFQNINTIFATVQVTLPFRWSLEFVRLATLGDQVQVHNGCTPCPRHCWCYWDNPGLVEVGFHIENVRWLAEVRIHSQNRPKVSLNQKQSLVNTMQNRYSTTCKVVGGWACSLVCLASLLMMAAITGKAGENPQIHPLQSIYPCIGSS